MKIYRIYEDHSSQYEQEYEELGYYLSKEKATEILLKIVTEKHGVINQKGIDLLKTKGFCWIKDEYIDSRGVYLDYGSFGIDEIEVIE